MKFCIVGKIKTGIRNDINIKRKVTGHKRFANKEGKNTDANEQHKKRLKKNIYKK